MLKKISPLLSPELLKILAEMGHGDEIVLADGNFPRPAWPSGWYTLTVTVFPPC